MARLPFRTPRGFDVAIKHIRAVNSVALYGSFTAAAADLGITQSAVSRLVLQLEKQLGVSLFLRSTRNVVLTAPGREFTASTRRFIEDLNIQVENARALGGQIRGRLIISCLLSITHHVVPDAVLRYRKAHPGVEIHLREGDELSDDSPDHGKRDGNLETREDRRQRIGKADQPERGETREAHRTGQKYLLVLDRTKTHHRVDNDREKRDQECDQYFG